MTTAMTKYKLRFDAFHFISFQYSDFSSYVEPQVVDCRFALMFAFFSFAFFTLRKFPIHSNNFFLFAGKSRVMIDAWIKVNLKRMG